MTQPTHDEVIAWIDDHLSTLKIVLTDRPFPELVIYDFFRASLLANRDVLERHKEIEYNRCGICRVVTGFGHLLNSAALKFPSPTYLDILQRIAEVMN